MSIKNNRIYMSGQLLELIIFAGIALFIINKLISTLGNTYENDPTKKNSFFGGFEGMKDVTKSVPKRANILRPKFSKTKASLKNIAVPGSEEEISKGLVDVQFKMPNFRLESFLKGARHAFKMIIDASFNNDESALGELIDKRYIEHFKAMAVNYGKCLSTRNNFSARASEIYMFGNNVFVKVLFTGENVTSKMEAVNEEWTFTKSILNSGPEWYLTNIDRPQ